jgi:hypothetical protein
VKEKGKIRDRKTRNEKTKERDSGAFFSLFLPLLALFLRHSAICCFSQCIYIIYNIYYSGFSYPKRKEKRKKSQPHYKHHIIKYFKVKYIIFIFKRE